jgi:predicted phosphoribosyltransferase
MPAAPPDTLASLRKTTDEAICLAMPIILGAIGF